MYKIYIGEQYLWTMQTYIPGFKDYFFRNNIYEETCENVRLRNYRFSDNNIYCCNLETCRSTLIFRLSTPFLSMQVTSVNDAVIVKTKLSIFG